jgi:hypothetical protein
MAGKSWSRHAADPERPCTKCGRIKADGARFRFKGAPTFRRHSPCIDCQNAHNRVYNRARRAA